MPGYLTSAIRQVVDMPLTYKHRAASTPQ